MYFCYIDESGTSSIPGNTSHFILAGIAVPVWHWKDCEREISVIKRRYSLEDKEIHTAWLMRAYLEQSRIPDFEELNHFRRRSQVEAFRTSELYRLQRLPNKKRYRQVKKNYIKTNDYIHLTFSERKNLVRDLARCISGWGFARLFAECIDKVYFDPSRSTSTIDEQAFEQIVSRFERYLQNIGNNGDNNTSCCGLLIHDNNQTVASKHTHLMKTFHATGTIWTDIENIIETPLFVDSQLTSMIQIADLCSYSIRRYLENGEEELFDLIFSRADRYMGRVVGIRHFSNDTCTCKICTSHNY